MADEIKKKHLNLTFIADEIKTSQFNLKKYFYSIIPIFGCHFADTSNLIYFFMHFFKNLI